MLKRWWNDLFPKNKDRRKSDRVSAPKLSVYYWNGSKPEKHEVRDISPTGIYVVTEERWYPGTIVKMTLQQDSEDGSGPEEHIAVESRAVRSGEDGVGMSFVVAEKAQAPAAGSLINEARDRKSLNRFLSRFLKKESSQ